MTADALALLFLGRQLLLNWQRFKLLVSSPYGRMVMMMIMILVIVIMIIMIAKHILSMSPNNSACKELTIPLYWYTNVLCNCSVHKFMDKKGIHYNCNGYFNHNINCMVCNLHQCIHVYKFPGTCFVGSFVGTSIINYSMQHCWYFYFPNYLL